jgi:GH24 family phage-related lysozyme (muramidase)/uncharacterized protein YoaH (UPF0181 family)
MSADRKAELEWLIKTQWLWNTAINREYNQLTGVNTAAWDFFNSIKSAPPTATQGTVQPTSPMSTPAPQPVQQPQPQQQVVNNMAQPVQPVQPKVQPQQPVQQPQQQVQQQPTYTWNSIVDFLKSTWQGSSFNDRAILARQLWISNYTWTNQQNTQMLNVLRNKQAQQPTQPTQPGQPVQPGQVDRQYDQYKWDPNSIFEAMKLWENIFSQDLKNTPEYKDAANRFRNFNAFKQLNATQFWALLSRWHLLPNTTLYNDLMSDPNAARNIMAAKNMNSINTSIKPDVQTKQTEEAQSEEILNSNLTVKTALSDWELSMAEFKQLTSSPEIEAKQVEMEKIRDEYIKMKNEWDNLADSIEKQYAWTGASSWFIAAKIARAQKDMFKWLSLTQARYEAVMWDLTTMRQEATSLLNTNLALYKDAQANERQLAAEQRQREFQLWTMWMQRDWQLEDRAYSEEAQTRQLEQQYAYQFGDLNSDNTTLQNIAIERAIWGMYQNYPIPWMESQATKVQKVKNMMAQGMSGTQAIAQIEQEIRNSPWYKNYMASERAKLIPQAEKPNWKQDASWNWYDANSWVNPATQTFTWDTAVNLISKWEWFRDKAYKDVWWIWTYWHGFTKRPDGTPVQPGDTISEQESKQRLQKEIEQRQNYMNFIKVPLSESQKAALSSFEFNLWSWIWQKDAMPILNAINNKDFTKAWNLMKQYNKARINWQLQPVQWLTNRRNEEARLIQDVSTSQPTQTYNSDFTRYFTQVNSGKPLNATETKMIEKEFWSISAFEKQAKVYWKKIDTTKALPQLQDFQKDLEYLRDNFSTTNMALLKTGVWPYAAVFENVKNKKAFDELVRLKGNGATFGALTEKEFDNIWKSTEIWKLWPTSWKHNWDTSINRMLRDVNAIIQEIEQDNPFVWQTQTWNKKTNSYNEVKTKSWNTYTW